MGDHGGRAGPARPPRRRWPRLAALVGVLALVLAVAACGGGGNERDGVASLGDAGSATGTASPGGGQARKPTTQDQQQVLDWARCMRQHGIDLPDPQVSGDNIAQQLPTRAEQNSPKFKAAQQACQQYLPNGGQPPKPNPQQQQAALAFAWCMRQHGINLPDPQFSGNGMSQEFSAPRGSKGPDPKFMAAQQACNQSPPNAGKGE
jgi:hypothetical protein